MASTVSPAVYELFDRPIAHRGLHSPSVPENSLGSICAAVDAGLGVEVDVRLSADGIPVVHHDPTLQRMCGWADRVARVPAALLTRQRLAGSDERLPTLAAALHAVGGRAPILLDLKSSASRMERRTLVDAVAISARAYRGPIGLVSFDPLLLIALACRAPRVVRGQSAGFDLETVMARWWVRAACHPFDALWSLRISDPDFVSFNVDRLPSPNVQRVRRMRPVLAWTVRDDLGYVIARRCADGLIVEGPAVDLALGRRSLAA